jgi:hypothetical protein
MKTMFRTPFHPRLSGRKEEQTLDDARPKIWPQKGISSQFQIEAAQYTTT